MKRKSARIFALSLAVITLVSGVFVSARAEQGAPIAENLEITTYRDTAVEGKLKAVSPDNEVVTFEITTPPSKGTVELCDSGTFVYTPDQGKRGKDYFGYKAVDGNGKYSSEATVIIKLIKPNCKVAYSDMDGNGAHCAAIALAERDVFVGEQIGGNYVFNPDAEVTRSEFLTMCMKLADVDILEGVITTGFADDESIPDHMKPYVSTALLTGVINGYYNSYDTAVFNGDSKVSYPEAAVILNRALRLTDVRFDEGYADAPVWAAQACANLNACKISGYMSSDALTRAECAKLLYGAIQVLEKR